MNRRSSIYSFLIITLYILLAEILLRFSQSSTEVLPYPSMVFKDIVYHSSYYLNGMLETTYTILGGLIPATIIGWSLAIFISESKLGNLLLRPLVDVSQLIPKTALLPLFRSIPFLGYSFLSKIVIVFLISFYPIFIDTLLGIKQINIQYINYFKIISPSKIKTIWYLKIPYSLPYSFNGLKTSVLYAVVGAVTSEILIGKSGLGYMIDYACTKLNFIQAYCGIISCIFLGGSMMIILNIFINRSKYLKYANK